MIVAIRQFAVLLCAALIVVGCKSASRSDSSGGIPPKHSSVALAKLATNDPLVSLVLLCTSSAPNVTLVEFDDESLGLEPQEDRTVAIAALEFVDSDSSVSLINAGITSTVAAEQQSADRTSPSTVFRAESGLFYLVSIGDREANLLQQESSLSLSRVLQKQLIDNLATNDSVEIAMTARTGASKTVLIDLLLQRAEVVRYTGQCRQIWS